MTDYNPHSDPAAPETQSAGAVEVLERTEESTSPGDNERYAHYVRKERIAQSLIEGLPVVALCGKVWVPLRNPDRFPICPTCKEIYEQMGKGGRDKSWPFGSGTPEQ